MPPKLPTNASPPKPRGRPIKPLSDPATDLQRTRIRRAQKAFRTRKEQHLNDLEEKCRTLENVVEEMSNTFLEFSDGLLRQDEGDKREGRVDGYVKKELKGTIERFLELGRRAAHEPREEGDETTTQHQETMVEEKTGQDTMPRIEFLGDEVESYSFSGTQLPVSTYTQPPQQALTPTYSHLTQPQRNPSLLVNNIWTFPPTLSVFPSSTSAIPYILAGRSSFSSRLYFSTIRHCAHSLHAASYDPLTSFSRYKIAHRIPVARIRNVLDGVLSMLLHGTSQTREGGRVEMDAFQRECEAQEEGEVKRMIWKEIEKRGGSVEEYLGTWDVERYLRVKWRFALDANAVRIQPRALLASGEGEEGIGGYNNVVVAPTMIPGFEHSVPRIWDAGTLVERLMGVAVSIGEGPRWHHQEVDQVVEAFLIEN